MEYDGKVSVYRHKDCIAIELAETSYIVYIHKDEAAAFWGHIDDLVKGFQSEAGGYREFPVHIDDDL